MLHVHVFVIKFSLMIKLSMHHSEFDLLMMEFMKACLLLRQFYVQSIRKLEMYASIK